MAKTGDEKTNVITLTEADQQVVRWIAQEVGDKVGEKISEAQAKATDTAIELHRATCPAGQQVLNSKKFLLGVAAGIGVISGLVNIVGADVLAAVGKLFAGR